MSHKGPAEVYEIQLERFRMASPEELAEKDDRGVIHQDNIIMHAVVNGVLAGKTWTAIAQDLNMDRRALYKLRQRVDFWDFVDSLMDEQMQDIADAKEKGEIELAMKFRNQLLQALLPRRVRQKIEAEEKVEFRYVVEEPNAEVSDGDQV